MLGRSHTCKRLVFASFVLSMFWQTMLNCAHAGILVLVVIILSGLMQKLPLSRFNGGNKGAREGPGACTICLGDVKPGDMLRKIQTCQHQFHSSCVDAWLARR